METFGSGRGRRRGEKHGSHAPPSVRPLTQSCSLRPATSPASPPSLPLVFGPLDCITPLALFFYSPPCSKEPPPAFYFIAIWYAHIWCATFSWQVAAGRKTRIARRNANGFCRWHYCIITGSRLKLRTREGADVFLRVVVDSVNITGNPFVDSKFIVYLLARVELIIQADKLCIIITHHMWSILL